MTEKPSEELRTPAERHALVRGWIRPADLLRAREIQRRYRSPLTPLEILAGDGLLAAGQLQESLAVESPEGVPDAVPDAAPPRKFGRFRILREVGRGAMGTVHQAEDPFLERRVALKVLDPSLLATEEGRERFFREGRLVAALRHPGIVAVHEAGTEDGQPYLVMDFIEGEPLASLLERERVPFFKAAHWTKEIAEALAYAHGKGVVHRDVKPGNVRINREGRAILMDFGLAREVKGGAGLTRAGFAVGTPAYMAPEQVEGAAVDGRADVYGAGALLYEMLTGNPPFLEPTVIATLRAVLDREPVAPRRIRPRIPVDLETICLTALAKDRGRRYRSPEALAADLGGFLAGEPIAARRPGILARGSGALVRHPLAAAAAMVAAAGCAALWREHPLYGAGAAVGLATGAAAGLAIRSRREARRRGREAASLLERLKAKEREEEGGWAAAFEDRFGREALGDAWKPIHGRWEIRGAVLAGSSEDWGAIVCQERISGNVRAEMELTVEPGAEAQDLSLFVNGAYLPRVKRLAGYQGIFGAAGNTGSVLQREGLSVAFSPAAGVEPGKRYRLLLEREDDRVRFLVDGVEILRYVDLFPIRGPDRFGLGIYFYRTSIRVHAFRAWRARVPQKISVLDAADDFFQEGHYPQARSRYRAIQESHPGSEMGRIAALKEATCLHQEGSLEEARLALERLAGEGPEDGVSDLARLHRARVLVDLGRLDEALAAVEALRGKVSPGSSVETLLGTFCAERGEWLLWRGRLPDARRLYEAQLRLFPADPRGRQWVSSRVLRTLIYEGRYRDAARHVERLLPEAPSPDQRARWQMDWGRLLARGGKAADAEKALREVLGDRSVSPSTVGLAAIELARLFLALGRAEEAEGIADWLSRRRATPADEWWLVYLRGLAARERSGPGEALRILAPLDEPGAPPDIRAEVSLWLARALAFETLQEREAGLNAYREAHRIFREAGLRSVPIHTELDLCRGIVRAAEIQIEAGNDQEGEARALRFLDEFPQAKEAGAHAALLLARVARARGEVAEALSILERIPADYPAILPVREEAAAVWAEIMAGGPAPAEPEIEFGDERAL